MKKALAPLGFLGESDNPYVILVRALSGLPSDFQSDTRSKHLHTVLGGDSIS